MKHFFSVVSIIILIFSISLFSSCKKTENNSITVYCYDSFAGDWGPGQKIIKDFEKETGIHVNLESCSGSVQLYSKILYEGSKCPADVVIGLPDSISIDTTLFLSWEPTCKNNLIPYSTDKLIPFDYGVFAFIFDTMDGDTKIPHSLKELAETEYKDKIILIDPRTSSVGSGLLEWSYYTLGNSFETWWSGILNNALTVADSWSSGYGLFTEGEAPLVISYITSPVYHLMNENSKRYKALTFTEGHIKTDEYLAILKKSNNTDKAKQFCEYILTKGQADIAVANTMYPANLSTVLPIEYSQIEKPELITVNKSDFISKKDSILELWTKTVVK